MTGNADSFLIAGVILLVLILIARMITERAMKALGAEDKVKLVDLFSGQRVWNLLLVIFLLIGYYAVVKMQLIDMTLGFLIYFLFLSGLMLFSSFRSWKKLKDAHIPASYIKAFIRSSVLRLIGLLGLLVASLF